jgi:hypothetical protein
MYKGVAQSNEDENSRSTADATDISLTFQTMHIFAAVSPKIIDPTNPDSHSTDPSFWSHYLLAMVKSFPDGVLEVRVSIFAIYGNKKAGILKREISDKDTRWNCF